MKWVFLMALLPTTALAGECHSYRLEGSVSASGNKAILKLYPKTQSERSFHLSGEGFLRLAPYVGKYVVGTFLFGDKGPINGADILKVEMIDLGVPDPLNPKQLSHLGRKPCP